jgi:hypothetical protein
MTCARLATGPEDDLAQTVRDPSVHQCLADDGDGGNQDHNRVAKACQRLLRREHAAQHQCQHNENRSDVSVRAPPAEQSDRARQHAEDDQHLPCHNRVFIDDAVVPAIVTLRMQ